MIFTDDGVDLPEQLLRSLENDRLVVFVGAGVSSRAFQEQIADTYYPDFKELTKEIAYRLRYSITSTDENYINQGYVDRVLNCTQK